MTKYGCLVSSTLCLIKSWHFVLAITLPDVDRFSNLCYCEKDDEICDKIVYNFQHAYKLVATPPFET